MQYSRIFEVALSQLLRMPLIAYMPYRGIRDYLLIFSCHSIATVFVHCAKNIKGMGYPRDILVDFKSPWIWGIYST